jgi:pSer/pThr/pTyr-binding forkhead associated (FHA) protein
MRVQLLCENVGFDDLQFEVSAYSLVLGRSVKADVRVGHPLVSRLHCEWKLVDGEVVVRDLESTNHTLVNGEPVQQAVLRSGDRILLGDVLYIVDLHENPPQNLEGQEIVSEAASKTSAAHLKVEESSWHSGER